MQHPQCVRKAACGAREPKVFREAEQKTAAEVCSNLDHVRFRVQELSEA